MSGDLKQFLESTEAFRFVDGLAVAGLVPALRVIELAPGETLLSAGGDDQNLYLLMSGGLRALGYNRKREERALLDVAPGECINEMPVLSGDCPTYSVVATSRSSVAALSRQAFEAFSTEWPAAGLK